MSKRGLGLVLVLTFAVGIAAASVFQEFRFDQSIALERASADAVTRKLDEAALTLANFRGAQAGYLAAGQGPDFWMKRATDLAADLEHRLTDVQAMTHSPEARAHYDAALAAVGGLNSLDQKARDDIGAGERLLASDVVFMDSTETAQKVSTELAAGADAEHAGMDVRVSGLRRLQFELVAGAMGGLILLAGIAAVRRGPPAARAPETLSLSIAPLPVPLPAEPPAPAPAAAPSAASAAPRLNLPDAAKVCVDLARVLDGQDVPPLLERAARVLGARGLVLWVADGSGSLLRPSLTHGYSEKVLQRLGPLQIDADNVTSLAFRSLQAQTLSNRSRGAADAIAVPLITSTGCVGVLAAEVAASGSGQDTLAVAQMFAAQLATIVTPSSAAEPAAAQA
jgi:hypothetical protein